MPRRKTTTNKVKEPAGTSTPSRKQTPGKRGRPRKTNAKTTTPGRGRPRGKRKAVTSTGESPTAKQATSEQAPMAEVLTIDSEDITEVDDVVMAEVVDVDQGGATDDISVATEVAKGVKMICHKIWIVVSTPMKPDVDFMSDLIVALHEWLDNVKKQDSHAGLALWTTKGTAYDVVKQLTPSVAMMEKYVYGFRASRKRGGMHFLRVNLALASTTSLQALMKEMEMWEDKPKRWMKPAPTSANDPVQVGWFLRSIRVQVSTQRWSELFTQAIGVEVGLNWARVSDGTFTPKGGKMTAPYAVHIECDEQDKYRVTTYLKKTYGWKATKPGPVAASVYFIPSLIRQNRLDGHGLSGQAKETIGKVVAYQRNHQKVSLFEFNDRVTDIDAMINTPKGRKPLRQILMSWKVKAIEGRIGDKLFLSIDETTRGSVTGIQFTYHKYVKQEAEQIALHLPLFVKHALKADPLECCTHSYVEAFEDWTWVVKKNMSCNPESEELQDMMTALVSGISMDDESVSKPATMETLITDKEYERINGRDDETLASLTATPKRVQKKLAEDTSVASGLSDLTGSTTESKSKRYAAEEVKKVTAQYQKIMGDQQAQHAEQCSLQQQALSMMMTAMESKGMDVSAVKNILASTGGKPRTSSRFSPSVNQDSGQSSDEEGSNSVQKLDFNAEADPELSGGEKEEDTESEREEKDDDPSHTHRQRETDEDSGDGGATHMSPHKEKISDEDCGQSGTSNDDSNKSKNSTQTEGQNAQNEKDEIAQNSTMSTRPGYTRRETPPRLKGTPRNSNGFLSARKLTWQMIAAAGYPAEDSSPDPILAEIQERHRKERERIDELCDISISSKRERNWSDSSLSSDSEAPSSTKGTSPVMTRAQRQRAGAKSGEQL